jgi:hypothetical protein
MPIKTEQTKFLGEQVNKGAAMPRRVTGPLDEVLPWVIEFRIVGTASTIQVRVSEKTRKLASSLRSTSPPMRRI